MLAHHNYFVTTTEAVPWSRCLPTQIPEPILKAEGKGEIVKIAEDRWTFWSLPLTEFLLTLRWAKNSVNYWNRKNNTR